ncbi:MAG TPA: C-GCAxxG-C-C family protein [Candidatus Bathyarchaeia archaeon]|nr:C-GCAxxG-C-C family protein [Candidatus Bathyarchaeia archaeon]
MSNKRAGCVEEAKSLYMNGYNCAQSVLLAMQKFWGVENPVEPKTASALGGGVGDCGSLCGALNGGSIAIGLKYGSNNPVSQERRKATSLALEFMNRFDRKCGGTQCIRLLGYDLTNPAELEVVRGNKDLKQKCAQYVGAAVDILTTLE